MKRPSGQAGSAKRFLIIISPVIIAGLVVASWYFAKSRSSEYDFAAIGLKASLPHSLKGLKTTVIKPPVGSKATLPEVTSLQDDDYTALANKCLGLPVSTKQSFANLAAVKKTQPGMPKPIRRVNGMYIVNMGSSLPSDVKCKDKATQQQLANRSAQLTNALDQALSSAQSD